MALNTRCPSCGTRLGAEDYLPTGELDCLLCKRAAISPHERIARAKKVTALVAAIDKSALSQQLNPFDQAGRIFAASLGWGDDHWSQIARLADVNEPSPITQRLVREVYKARSANPGEQRVAS